MLAQVENIPTANLIGWIIGVAAAVIFFWILYSVIQGAVLSALRTHRRESRSDTSPPE
jgi:uncharacterized membrane protein